MEGIKRLEINANNKKQKILSQFPQYCRKKIKLDKKKLTNLFYLEKLGICYKK